MRLTFIGIGALAAGLALGCKDDGVSATMAAPTATAASPLTAAAPITAAASATAADPTTAADSDYAKDLRTICHVHELTGKAPDEGVGAVAPWLLEHIRSRAALEQLRELPHADVIAWLQRLRRDAAQRGVSPCPFADTWEEILKRPSK